MKKIQVQTLLCEKCVMFFVNYDHYTTTVWLWQPSLKICFSYWEIYVIITVIASMYTNPHNKFKL